MNINHPLNTKVLAYLTQGREEAPACAPPDAIANAYYGAGCHPEIVERLWERFNGALPTDCRVLVRRTPALVHPGGVILALGMGTAYGMCLPGELAAEAVARGCRTLMVWSGGAQTDIRESFGDDWCFGCWHAQEPQWCRRAYDSL